MRVICQECGEFYYSRPSQVKAGRIYCSIRCKLGLNIASAFFRNVKKSDGCWSWLGTKHDGYGVLCYLGKRVRAHRLSWEIHNNEKIPEGLLVCHKCDNPECSNPDHLFVGTQQDNIDDMRAKNRGAFGLRNGKTTKPEFTPRGENHGRSKLTTSQVIEIRNLYIPRVVSSIKLAKRFGVTKQSVLSILKKENWAHV